MKKMLLILIGFAIAADVNAGIGVDTFSDDANGTVTFDVHVENESDIAGYQFDLLSDGLLTITSADASGLSGTAGFMLSSSASTVIAFSLSGSTIPGGSSGILCTITATYDVANAGQIVALYDEEEGAGGNRLLFSGAGGTQLDAMFYDRDWTVGSGALDINSQLINKFELSDNYPNPFNPSTNISFSLASYGEVTIVVFDALGREVNELVSDVYTPGSYNVVWNGTDFNGKEMSSGMYFYRLNAGEFTQTKKMLFMK